MSLKDRCREFLALAQRRAITRTGSPVDDLHEFVLSEIGRSSDPSLENTNTVVLYFDSGQDLDEFVSLVKEAKPGLTARKI